MKRLKIEHGVIYSLALLVMMSLMSLTSGSGVWLIDLEEAKVQAKTENKLVLLNFSGSDWCGNCMRLEKTLFEAPSFVNFAAENLVLVNADFPMRKKNKLSPAQTTKNEALAEKYNPQGAFPTVVIMTADGVEVARLTQPQETAEDYLKELQSIIEAQAH